MADPVGNTFGTLRGVLQSLGFEASRRGDSYVFAHAGGPMLLLPAYRSGQAVRPIHMAMVDRYLYDAGMIGPGGLASLMRAQSSAPAESL